jgi:hypothetical protein
MNSREQLSRPGRGNAGDLSKAALRHLHKDLWNWISFRSNSNAH